MSTFHSVIRKGRSSACRAWLTACILLGLLLSPFHALGAAIQPEPAFPLAALCFGGEADHQYFGDHLAVQIQSHFTGSLAYFICDIQTDDPTALRTALSSGGWTSSIAADTGAVLAVNGDDYGVHKYGVIIRDGELLRAANTTRHMLVLDEQGDLSVISDRKSEKPKALAKRLQEAGVQQTWEFGPELVRDGTAVPFTNSFDLISQKTGTLEPRTAIGQVGPLHYVIIVVDGRRPGYSDGISLSSLQQMMLDAGAQTAFNLDGGGSTTLVFRGQVLNRPSGGRERSVTDILYFR